jgi:hypothetical protein
VQIADLIYQTHLLSVVCYNFNKAAHNVRKEGNSAQHQKNSYKSFHVADRIEISISDSGQRSERVVATNDQFPPVRYVLKLKKGHKSHSIFDIFGLVQIVTYHVPETTNEVGYKKGDDDESEYSIDVHKHINGNDSFLSLKAV